MSIQFNVEMIKGYTRTTGANRVSAVQMIASGVSGGECQMNALTAFTTCKEIIGADKGSVSLYKSLADMPAKVWSKFPLASNDSKDGEKQATALVRLAQAWTLCSEAGVGYGDGWKVGYEEGCQVAEPETTSVQDTTATTATTSVQDTTQEG